MALGPCPISFSVRILSIYNTQHLPEKKIDLFHSRAKSILCLVSYVLGSFVQFVHLSKMCIIGLLVIYVSASRAEFRISERRRGGDSGMSDLLANYNFSQANYFERGGCSCTESRKRCKKSSYPPMGVCTL